MIKGSNRLKTWRWIVVSLLLLDIFAIGYFSYLYLDRIPNKLHVVVGETESVELPGGTSVEQTYERGDNVEVSSVETMKVVNNQSGFTMTSNRTGNYSVSVKLFGMIPVKKVSVQVVEKMKLSPGGEPIGIYVATNGLLVLDTAEIQGEDGLTYSPGENILKTGDYILEWNHQPVTTIESFNKALQKTGNKKVSVKIRRGKEVIEVAVKPIRATDRSYKIGAWIREDTQGIGTLTYVTANGGFGTLGHGITDSDTGELLDLQGGELYQTKILGILRGEKGEPGELRGYINMVAKNQIGTIKKNTALGVFGTIQPELLGEYAKEFLPVGMKQEIKKGKAYIYTKLSGEIKKYEIQIEKTYLNSKDNKSMVIHVTDSELLARTGGIVQGMSGSPILQDGKIIGAVTHVMVDDPTRGYGVFIENMLSFSEG